MKRAIIIVFLMIFSLSASTVFANKPDTDPVSDKSATPVKTENKLSEEELNRLKTRVEEIRDMDKKDLTAEEKAELRKELKEIRESISAVYWIYIGLCAVIIIASIIVLASL